jgi:hypothetical protein
VGRRRGLETFVHSCSEILTQARYDRAIRPTKPEPPLARPYQAADVSSALPRVMGRCGKTRKPSARNNLLTEAPAGAFRGQILGTSWGWRFFVR